MTLVGYRQRIEGISARYDRRNIHIAETKATASIGFEKQIWDAACVLRGNIDASEYKNVVLGLIFLKYISERFDEKYQAIVEEGDGFEEDIDEYTSEGIFFVPPSARWREIAAKAHTPEIGAVIDDAMRSIERENKRLKDILPKNFARPELDKRRLGDVVDLFTNIQMVEHGSEKDILGRTYEYCLAKFAEQEGKLAGELYTPSCVVRTLVEILQPYSNNKEKVISVISHHLGTIEKSLPEITFRTPRGTAKQPIYQARLTEEKQLRVETIHSVKGGTFDAVLLLSTPDGRGKTGYWENWLKSDEESGRIGYVASTRPRYLLCWGVSNLTNTQRQELERIGCIKLDR